MVDHFGIGGDVCEGGEVYDGGTDDSHSGPEAWDRYRSRPDDEDDDGVDDDEAA